MVVAGTERRYALAKENPMELSRIIASGTIGHSLAGGELSAISLIRPGLPTGLIAVLG